MSTRGTSVAAGRLGVMIRAPPRPLSASAAASPAGPAAARGAAVAAFAPPVLIPRFARDSLLEGARFGPSVPVWRAAVFEPAVRPQLGGRFRRGGDGPAEIAAQIARLISPTAQVRLRASAGSRIKLSRRVGPSQGTEGSNLSPSSEESTRELVSLGTAKLRPYPSRAGTNNNWAACIRSSFRRA
jgi:hypothetical protein